MNDDYILRLIESVGKFAAKIFHKEDSEELQRINIEAMSAKDILPILLKRLVLEGRYNDAEDILFNALEKEPSESLVETGNSFYNLLLSKSDEELAKGNFSREEILQGIEDLKKFSK